MPEVYQSGKILKVDEELQVVWGWGSVITKNGVPVEDTQGDMIRPAVLLKAVHEFVSDSRAGGFMHVPGIEGGEIVESMVFTYALQKALGIEIRDDKGAHIEGWLAAYKVESETLWKKVKSGDFAEFSFGGEGVRIPA